MKADKATYWHFELALDYFEDKLDPIEKEEFNRLIEEDERFKNWMEEIYQEWIQDPVGYRAEMDKFSYSFLEGLRKFSKEDASNNLTWIVIGIAASILILISAYFWFTPTNTCRLDDYKCWIGQNGGLYKERITNAGGGLSVELADIASAYKDSSFEEVLRLAPQILPSKITKFQRNEVRLYQGISYLYLERYVEAIDVFRMLSDQPEPYKTRSLWYSSLSQLAIAQNEAAEESLTLLTSYPNPFQETAYTLLGHIP